MLSGPFGGVHGKDMLMVQSMDGKLQVFDQTAEAFTCQMTDCLLPGHLLYLRRMDAFVTTNYANRIECYRFQVVVVVSHLRGVVDVCAFDFTPGIYYAL